MLNAELIEQVIQRKRKQKKLSQEDISVLAGIGRMHLSAIERGERKPTLGNLLQDRRNIERLPKRSYGRNRSRIREIKNRPPFSNRKGGFDHLLANKVLT